MPRIVLIHIALRLFVAVVFFTGIIFAFQWFSSAEPVPAKIIIDSKYVTGPLPYNWKALAQGGEEPGKRMFANSIQQLTDLRLRYIRIDHVYNGFEAVQRDTQGKIYYTWERLDEMVCDILDTGAKPFFVLGYMPPVLSADGSLISQPTSGQEWTSLVRATIERYSGKNTVLCGKHQAETLANIYYEVWNEPDLENFGKWSLYGGAKDYKQLYHWSSTGAQEARNVQNFLIGGPATTKAYKNWMQVLLRYITRNNLRIDFLSWHHYDTDPDAFRSDAAKVADWLTSDEFARYRMLPKVISEWGYDSRPNPIADTAVGAAHTIMSIRNLVEQNIELAFAFEAKDGPNGPTWGVLTYEGIPKPRYKALQLLNVLDRLQLSTVGEGSHVRAIASRGTDRITVVLVNYDRNNSYTELTPVSIKNLDPGTYRITFTYLSGETTTIPNIDAIGGTIERSFLLPPNMVVAIELKKQ